MGSTMPPPRRPDLIPGRRDWVTSRGKGDGVKDLETEWLSWIFQVSPISSRGPYKGRQGDQKQER